MKPENQGNSEQLLNQALSEWRVKESLPPRFTERVWQRIAQEPARGPAMAWRLLIDWVNSAMARRSLAASYVTLLLLTGLLAGFWRARMDTARTSETLASRYVQMIDPYQTGRH